MALLWGRAGILIYNDAYAVIAGNKHPQLLGMNVVDAWPEAAEFNTNVMDKVLQGQRLSYVDQGFELNRNGAPEQVWLNLDYSPVPDEDGTPVGVLAVVVETTERFHAERVLQENEKQLRFLDGLAAQTIQLSEADVILATTTRMLGEYLQVAICAYADVEPDTDHFNIRGDWSLPGVPSLVGHYKLSSFGRLVEEQLHTGLPLVLNDVHQQLAPDDAHLFLQLGVASSICMPLIKDGKLTAMMAVHGNTPRAWKTNEISLLREVTERSWAHIERVRAAEEVRKAELRFVERLEEQVEQRTAQLMQSEANIRAIFDTSHLYQWMTCPAGNVIYANATALAGAGTTLAEVEGQPFWNSPWFDHSTAASETVKAAMANVAAGATESFSLSLEQARGMRHFDFSIRPMRDNAGAVIGMVPEALDKTDRLKVEQALHQSQKMEAIGKLTGGIAHDFNNLLTVVQSSLDLLTRRVPEEPRVLRLIDSAKEAANRGASLTARMLSFARMQDLQRQPNDVEPLLIEIGDFLRLSLGPMIILDVQVAPSLPRIDTDRNQLESALLNLAVNARDAMDGEGLLTITAQARTLAVADGNIKPGDYVCLSVIDQGTGMDAPTLKRALDPFFTTKAVGEGTGLGLSMAYGFAEQSGGGLKLHSVPGRGTTVELWLPAIGQADADLSSQAAATVAFDRSGKASAVTILLVDDDELVLNNTSTMLEEIGHQVVKANSGGDALSVLERTQVDLVITDYAMPFMSGLNLAAEISKHWPTLPVILVSGYVERHALTRYDLPFLSKPFSLARIDALITNVLQAPK